mgnify:CR=1 FL=1|jgi:sterol desaturase/sphingolipid hydroxylase (fatty acid hydroxylase superfamily)
MDFIISVIINIINIIVGYYFFTLQQYIIHRIQHSKYFKTHRLKHHKTYDRNNITSQINTNSLYENLDFYFYGNILIFPFNYLLFDTYVLCIQLFIAYLSYYFHNEYHNPNSYWKEYQFYKYLKQKHQIHHEYPTKNHFLLDPTFDIIFGTYK